MLTKGGTVRFKNVARLVTFVLCIITAFSTAMAGTAERKNITTALTNEYRQEGWSDLTFEVTGKDYKTLKLTQKNVIQNKPLTEGQLISGLGSILTPEVVKRLKKAGFKRGIFIDGHSRSYSFEISRKYYDKSQSFINGLGQ
jgi:hypothetical protein